MMTAMTWDELLGWMAFAEREPFGEERADLRSASVVAAIYNVNRDPRKRREPFSPQDFMPKFGKAKAGAGAAGGSGKRKPLKDPAEWRRISRNAAAGAAAVSQ